MRIFILFIFIKRSWQNPFSQTLVKNHYRRLRDNKKMHLKFCLPYVLLATYKKPSKHRGRDPTWLLVCCLEITSCLYHILSLNCRFNVSYQPILKKTVHIHNMVHLFWMKFGPVPHMVSDFTPTHPSLWFVL